MNSRPRMSAPVVLPVRSLLATSKLGVILALSALAGSAAAETWDLADDWSDVSNPNGAWSYNGAPDGPITTALADWDPYTDGLFGSPQPAWAAATYPNNNHVPAWFKRVSNHTPVDIPVGKVGMHGNEFDDPNVWVGVAWTSPGSLTVDVTGAVWYAHTGQFRNADWRVRLNDIVLTGSNVAFDDGSSSDNPTSLLSGSGGAPALQALVVETGDKITLELISLTSYACFIGVDLTIAGTDPIDCPGDLDGDLDVDQADLGTLLSCYGTGDCGDIDGDGDTDQADLGALLANYGTDCR